MKFEFLFIDLDHTILDFHKTEYYALGATLKEFGLEPTDQVRADYSRINQAHWDKLATGELTREQVLLGRFEEFSKLYGLTCQPAQMAATYEHHIAYDPHYFLPGAGEALAKLNQKYRLFLASNGTAEMQYGKLKSLGIRELFEDCFVSQELGVDKPNKAFFDRSFAKIQDFDPTRALMVGDSLSADIQGGINAGIATCWVNPGHKPQTVPADYELESLAQLPDLLETL